MLLQSKYDIGDYVQAYTNTSILWITMKHVFGQITFVGFDTDHFWYKLYSEDDSRSYVVSEREIEGKYDL